MTPAERQSLRERVDRARRKLVAVDDARFGPGCAGCRMPLRDWTPGCTPCSNRHSNWRRGRTRGDYDPLLHRAVLRHAEQANQDLGKRTAARTRGQSMPTQLIGTAGSWREHLDVLKVSA